MVGRGWVGRRPEEERKGKVYSSIQVWPTIDAPRWLLELLGRGSGYDWVAFVPHDLNNEEVIGLLIRDAGKTRMELMNLTDGSALVAGKFEEHNDSLRPPIKRRPMSRERARTAFFR
jgi:hypothetical protein